MSHHDELLRLIRDVRTRWRWKVVLRSLTVLVGAAIVTVLAGAYGLEQYRFSPAAIIVFRIVTYLVLAALGWFFFVRPLRRHVTDQQVALYLEEHEPSLKEMLVSAVDVGAPTRAIGRWGESAALLRRLIESAVERCQQRDIGRGLERESLRRSLVAITVIGIVAVVVFVTGPAYLRQGALAVLVPIGSVEAASPYRIDVNPGNATVARGADVSIAARLAGFTSTEVDLFTRASPGAPFDRVPMTAVGEAFESTFFALKQSTEYFVQAAGVRSPVFKLEAAELPFVKRMEMEFMYPAYTGLAPRTIDEGGDIAVLRGTTVRLKVYSTLSTTAGRIVRDERQHVPLIANADGTLSGSFDVREDGIYRIDLASAAGALITASPQYTIDVLTDQSPTASFSKPGRDLRATSLDEIFVEASAGDDFGVRQLDIVYTVNGGSERQVRLTAPSGHPLAEVTAGHTFFLEELGLLPGDVVSYYARATDNDEVSGAKSVTSDMFFLQIQPFRKDYRASESQAGGQAGGQQGGAGSDPSALSEQQRRIVSGTFNTVRDRAASGEEKFRQDVVFLALTQGQLRERAAALAVQIRLRVAQVDATMVKISEALDAAATAMGAAEQRLQARDPKNALPKEQQALANLQRAEEAYRDVRVRMSQERRGGGGGQQSSGAAQELADLFRLEADKLRNQYETFQRSQQQTADTKVDAMLERLKELARRQEQEAERQRQMAGSRQQGAGSAAGARQRQLAEETEDAARQLDRLSREDDRQDLAEMARGLRAAADAMRRAAASGDATAFAEARAAADRLGQARDRLDQQRTDRMARDIDSALSRVRRLQNEEQGIEAGVRSLDRAGADRGKQVQQLMERKDAQAGDVADIERQLDRTAADFRRERPQAARKVQEAADAIRDDKLKEKIRYSKGLVQGAEAEVAAGFEEQIGTDIASLAERLRGAAGAVGTQARDSRADALARAGGLVRGVDSMDQRLREQRQAGSGQGRGTTQPGGERTQEPGGLRQQRGDGAPRGGDSGAPDPRQFQREAKERRGEAQALRRDLQALGVNVKDLDAVIGALAALDSTRVYTDFDEIARLEGQLSQALRRFEFTLRRELGAGVADQLFLSGSDEAPEAYRKMIEEYFRALAREKKS